MSPTNQLDSYFAPRKSQRLAVRTSKSESLRQVRQRGSGGSVPGLTGHLGSIPQEVRQFANVGADLGCRGAHPIPNRHRSLVQRLNVHF